VAAVRGGFVRRGGEPPVSAANLQDCRGSRPAAGLHAAPGAMVGLQSELASISDLPLVLWARARGYHPNLLVLTKDPASQRIARLVLTSCATPLHLCRLPGRLRLPTAITGTLLVSDVSTLTSSQQHEMNDWLATCPGQVQVVSVTTRPLELLVERGEFLAELFYRLNIVRLDTA
jgi:hypothetical protein